MTAPRRASPIESLLLACALVSVATTAGILLVLATESVAFFRAVPLREFLLAESWTPRMPEPRFGVRPLVVATLLTSGIAVAVALPMGLLAAIYLGEFASPRAQKLLKPALELLAGVPTIVYGYFALLVITPLLQRVVPDLAGYNALAPGIVLGIMIVPIICSLSEEAIRAVPHTLREAAYALGAGRLQTIFRVVLPTASRAITASVILGLSRAAGETMIVAIAAGTQSRLTFDPREPALTMTSHLLQVELGNIATGTLDYHAIFAVGATLFAFTFATNGAAQLLIRRYRGR
jgi:phosphate transport system permease protein